MFKIRTASKNFLCEKCNTLINCGDEYFDTWDRTKDGDYYHKRFHTTCICNKKNVTDDNFMLAKTTISKPTLFDRVQKLIEKENGSLIASNDGIKCYICGIGYNQNDEKGFLCMTWEDKKPFFETADNMKKYIDCYGNHF